ncbi:hypothetical protein D3C87_1727980 [compost metagenome]
MHGGTSAIEHIQGGELPRGQGWRNEPRPMGDEELQVFRHAGGMRGNQRAIRAVGVEGYQCAIETGLVMGASDFFHVLGLQDRAAAGMDFRRVVAADVTDEFNTHGEFLVVFWT